MTHAIESTKIQYIIFVKSEMVFCISITIFARLFFFFSMHMYCLFDVGQNFWAFADGVRRGNFYTGPKSFFMFVVFAFKGKQNYLFRNFVAPQKFFAGTRPEKSIAYNLQYVS